MRQRFEGRSLPDIDLRKVVESVRQRYALPIPSKVLMADYDEEEGDLYVRFRESRRTSGTPTDDGLVIVHRDGKGIASIEILGVAQL